MVNPANAALPSSSGASRPAPVCVEDVCSSAFDAFGGLVVDEFRSFGLDNAEIQDLLQEAGLNEAEIQAMVPRAQPLP